MRKYLINLHIEAFRTTLFRQTMFAEFEALTHAYVEEGGKPDAAVAVRRIRQAEQSLFRPGSQKTNISGTNGPASLISTAASTYTSTPQVIPRPPRFP